MYFCGRLTSSSSLVSEEAILPADACNWDVFVSAGEESRGNVNVMVRAGDVVVPKIAAAVDACRFGTLYI